MTNPKTPWESALADLGDAFRAAGNILAAQWALSHLLQGNKTRAAETIDTLPDDAVQTALDAAASLAGLLMLKGRARGLEIQDPFSADSLTQDPPTPA